MDCLDYQISQREKPIQVKVDETEAHPEPFYIEDEDRKHMRISIFSIVRRIREQRWNLVKNVEQYRYAYAFTK